MNIRNFVLVVICASGLAFNNGANAQVAEPVGFLTMSVNGGAYSLLSTGLVNPTEYQSQAILNTFVGTSGTISFDGTPFAGIDFGAVAEVFGDPGVATAGYVAYYVEVTTGPEAGAWANIISSDDNQLIIDRDLSAAGAETMSIRKHITIADLFGAANEAGLDGDEEGSVAGADEVILYRPQAIPVIFYVTADGLAGWYDSTLRRSDNVPIEPQQAVLVNRKQPSNVTFTRAGHIKTGPTKLSVNPGLNALANPRVVGSDDDGTPVFTLGNSNLWDSSDPANSIDASEDGNISKADQITIFNDPGHPDGPFSVYFYVSLNGFAGWYDSTLTELKNDVVLEAGKGFLLNRRSGVDLTGTPFTWTVPAEKIAP